jgi:hypothetical protein
LPEVGPAADVAAIVVAELAVAVAAVVSSLAAAVVV